MRIQQPIIAKCFHILFAVATVSTLHGSDEIVTKPMLGHWEGRTCIVVDWCKQKQLSVSIDIYQDGTVTGKIGDATLTAGQFKQNRGWLGRKLNLATDYIITGSLNGAIVAAEHITRSSVKIPLDFCGNTFAGGVNTSGSGIEGFDEKKGDGPMLSAGSLKLTHPK